MSAPGGLFIAGTDTEVGKTLMSGALLAALRGAGRDAGYLKPVGSDATPQGGHLVNPDPILVAGLAGLDEAPHELCLYNLPQPLAPLPAARRAGIDLRLPEILERCQEALTRHAFTLVEGVGGVLAPLTEEHTGLDLMAGLGLPVLVVGRPGLGTINHTLLTVEAVRRRGLAVAGFVFSEGQAGAAPDPSRDDNPSLIQQFCGAPYWGALPWLGPRPGRELVLEAVANHLDLEALWALAPA